MPKEWMNWFDAVFLQSAEDPKHGAGWMPAADVYRSPGGWLVKVDIAGVRPEDVKIALHGQTLSISGHRRDQLATQGLTYHRLEIRYSHFERTLELPESLDNARLEVEMDQGMLIVRISKT